MAFSAVMCFERLHTAAMTINRPHSDWRGAGSSSGGNKKSQKTFQRRKEEKKSGGGYVTREKKGPKD